jgi:hypothetical protein
MPNYQVQQDHISALTTIGVDCARSFYVTQRNKRSTVLHKAYICLSIGTNVKAIHLKLVGDLTTVSLLAALECTSNV